MGQSWGALLDLSQIKLEGQCFRRVFSMLTDCIQSLVGPDLFFFEINPNEIFMVACQVISTTCLTAQLCFQWTPVLADVYMACCHVFFSAEVVSDSLALKELVEMSQQLSYGATPPIALLYIRREEGRKLILFQSPVCGFTVYMSDCSVLRFWIA